MPRSATPFGDQADNLVAQTLFEIDADIRVSGQKGAQGLRQELGQRIGVGQNADLAAQAAAISGEIFVQPLGLTQDGAGMLQQGPPGLGRGDAAPAAGQERDAQRLLHVADARRGRRQRQIRTLRAVGDAAGLDHVSKQTEIGQIETHDAAFAKRSQDYNNGDCIGANQ